MRGVGWGNPMPRIKPRVRAALVEHQAALVEWPAALPRAPNRTCRGAGPRHRRKKTARTAHLGKAEKDYSLTPLLVRHHSGGPRPTGLNRPFRLDSSVFRRSSRGGRMTPESGPPRIRSMGPSHNGRDQSALPTCAVSGGSAPKSGPDETSPRIAPKRKKKPSVSNSASCSCFFRVLRMTKICVCAT